DDGLHPPTVDGAPASWDAALDHVARRFSETIAAHGPDSVALYVSGQLLTEDYYVANKLMKGFVGSANIDTNSRLCMSSSVAGHKRAFGSDTVPGVYEDLELADLVVLVGSNLAWCHPVLFQRLAAARERRGTKVVVIDPRATATSEIADLHLAIAPGSDVALFNGLLASLAGTGRLSQDYVARYTCGLDAALAAARKMGLGDVAEITGLAVARIAEFYSLFAATERVVTVYSQGVNQSTSGTDKVNAIINCHLATGRIGRPGMGPFSVTGQPNAMGGREVGGLANMLAAHMELDDARHRRLVARYWNAPRLAERAGLKAVDMFRAIGDGRIKAVWIVATNPVVSLPEANRVRDALAKCPFVVVSDVSRHTDTTALGDVLLPAAAWGEKDGTVTNSERCISRQRAFLPVPGEARPDWWQIAEVGRRMGYGAAFGYSGPCEIFAEHAGLTGIGNGGTRDLDISAFADITQAAYEGLEPFQWPRLSAAWPAERRFFGEGGFFTPDRRARFVATPYRPPAHAPSPPFPLVLSTGRIRDQWHTMTRTGKSARLMAHIGEPFLAVHPDDARRIGVEGADLAVVESAHGRAVLRVVVTPSQRRGSVFAPMHWNDQLASAARIGAVVNAETDLVSGQPEMKHTPVDVHRLPAAWYGYMVSLARPEVAGHAYAAIAPVGSGWRAEIAGSSEPACWDAHARMLLKLCGSANAELVAYHDAAGGQYRYAVFDDENRLAGALYLAAEPVSVSRGWLGEQLGTAIAPEARLAVLAGRPGPGVRDRGAIVCACFEVGLKEITEAVVRDGCRSVAAVGERLKAGTNCGSCRAEIGRIVAQSCPRPADRLAPVATR
ncbi:MAG: molybdopterin-dependent oxidoreductase, partial [Pseudomonadota bacterium]